MSLTKLLESDIEKPPFDSAKPIVFRPINPPTTFGTPSVGFRSLFHRDIDDEAGRYRRCRLLMFYGTFLVVSLILVFGLVSAMFMLGVAPFSSLYHHGTDGHGLFTSSRCHIVLFPDSNQEGMDGELSEEIFSSTFGAQNIPAGRSDTLNISLNAFPPFPTAQILHIFADNLTVIRTQNRCYIRPMREEMRRAYKARYLNQLHDGIQRKDSLEGEVVTEPLYTTREPENPGIIRNSLIMLWCKGVPAFRLVTQRPPTIPVSDWFPRTPSSSPHDLSILVRDNQPAAFFPGRNDDLVEDGLMDTEDETASDDEVEALIRRRSPHRRIRQRRSFPLSNAMHVDPEDLPRVNLKPACKVLEQVMEDFIVTPEANTPSSSKVRVTRDVILEC